MVVAGLAVHSGSLGWQRNLVRWLYHSCLVQEMFACTLVIECLVCFHNQRILVDWRSCNHLKPTEGRYCRFWVRIVEDHHLCNRLMLMAVNHHCDKQQDLKTVDRLLDDLHRVAKVLNLLNKECLDTRKSSRIAVRMDHALTGLWKKAWIHHDLIHCRNNLVRQVGMRISGPHDWNYRCWMNNCCCRCCCHCCHLAHNQNHHWKLHSLTMVEVLLADRQTKALIPHG